MQNGIKIIQICVRSPLWRLFDYLPADKTAMNAYHIGQRVRVPFGRSTRVGIVLGIADHSDIAPEKLKRVESIIDVTPLLTPAILALYHWASDYYQYPLGEVIFSTLPKQFRLGQAATLVRPIRYRVNSLMAQHAEALLKKAKRQRALYDFILQHEHVDMADLYAANFYKADVQKLIDKEVVVDEVVTVNPTSTQKQQPLTLNEEQAQAVAAITNQPGFHVSLLAGVTGSGKTEVYLQAISQVLQQGKQALYLVPEIALTPQTVSRFTQRFSHNIVVMHSGLNDSERYQAWLAAATGEAAIVIGTRSAIFTPFKQLGMIVLDEEHDTSFKQQSGFRYSARDIAVKRAHALAIPVVLGSATPSIESLHNAKSERYQLLRLSARIAAAASPKVTLLDLRDKKLMDGMAPALLEKIRCHLQQQGQVLVFLNRRGYAPVMMCHHCGWVALCERCDARMTWHAARHRLICHHCQSERAPHRICNSCHQEELITVGVGTERLQDALTKQFPDTSIVRIDRDSTRKKGALQNLLTEIDEQRANIIIGTQMLAKGHHFPNLTLVVIVDADTGLFSTDFRAMERMAQLLVQVAGRAGRAERVGEVVLQTHHPEHAALKTLLGKGYFAFVEEIIKEREAYAYPPYGYLALLRAEAHQQALPQQFLRSMKKYADRLAIPHVQVLGPVASPMEKRAGRFRAQLLLRANQRGALQTFMRQFREGLQSEKLARHVRWSLDVDPQEMT